MAIQTLDNNKSNLTTRIDNTNDFSFMKKIISVALVALAASACIYFSGMHIASLAGISNAFVLPLAISGAATYTILKLKGSSILKSEKKSSEKTFDLKKLLLKAFDKKDLYFLAFLGIFLTIVILGPHVFTFCKNLNMFNSIIIGEAIALPVLTYFSLNLCKKIEELKLNQTLEKIRDWMENIFERRKQYCKEQQKFQLCFRDDESTETLSFDNEGQMEKLEEDSKGDIDLLKPDFEETLKNNPPPRLLNSKMIDQNLAIEKFGKLDKDEELSGDDDSDLENVFPPIPKPKELPRPTLSARSAREEFGEELDLLDRAFDKALLRDEGKFEKLEDNEDKEDNDVEEIRDWRDFCRKSGKSEEKPTSNVGKIKDFFKKNKDEDIELSTDVSCFYRNQDV
jgi:hypothetical protein